MIIKAFLNIVGPIANFFFDLTGMEISDRRKTSFCSGALEECFEAQSRKATPSLVGQELPS